MRVRIHADAAGFLAGAGPFLRADPFSTSVIASVAQRAADDPASGGGDRIWVTVDDEGAGMLGVAMHTPPFPLFVSRMPRGAAAALADALLDDGRELPGVNGAREPATAFLDAWADRTGQAARPVQAMRMYRLETLRPPSDVPGSAALVTAADTALLVKWFEAFGAEALAHAPAQDQAEIVARQVAAHEIHLWRDGDRPVSVAAARSTGAGVARIGPVYTPPEARRRGYGSAIAAAASAAALAAGAAHVVLYADLANPTSNSIYRAIGYRPDHDAGSWLFSAGAERPAG